MSISTFDIFRVEHGTAGSHLAAPRIAAGYLQAQTIDEHPIPYPFRSIDELLQMSKESSRTIADLMLENEKCWRSTYDIRAGLLEIADAMEAHPPWMVEHVYLCAMAVSKKMPRRIQSRPFR
ncbi:hypothetical protein AWV80_07765 [Cupriavidus sp. UYMU48A]|nr:hypothetical protein AWV80_07765 [Cupriavidus sp. UYMU48A]